MTDAWPSKHTAPGWYVTIHGDSSDMPIRGPYKHDVTAGAIRAEIERGDWADDKNLWIVEVPGLIPDPRDALLTEMAAALREILAVVNKPDQLWISRLFETARIASAALTKLSTTQEGR